MPVWAHVYTCVYISVRIEPGLILTLVLGVCSAGNLACLCEHMCIHVCICLCASNLAWFSPWCLVCALLETSGVRRKDSSPPTWHSNLSTPHWSPAVFWIELGKRVWLSHLTTIYFLFFRSFPANFFPKGRKCSKDHPCWSQWVQDTSTF